MNNKEEKHIDILIVDDEEIVRNSLKDLLESEGYEVMMAKSGKQALKILQEKIPSLLILDLVMPDMDGFQVCREIRKNASLRRLPIVLLTGKGTFEDKITSLKEGCDVYIRKPIEISDLLVKIKSIIKRTYFELDRNYLTNLSGNNSFQKEIIQKIKSKQVFAVCYLDINNFKVFNNKYSFTEGDVLLKLMADIISEATCELDPSEVFIGHLGKDDFVLIINTTLIDQVLKKILNLFNLKISKPYANLTLSIGVVTNLERSFSHPAEIEIIGEKLLQKAKNFPESKYLIDEGD